MVAGGGVRGKIMRVAELVEVIQKMGREVGRTGSSQVVWVMRCDVRYDVMSCDAISKTI